MLVHGGAHAADCWDLVVAELQKLAPQLRVLAINLPGRADKPGDLSTIGVRDFVDSVIADIEAAGLHSAVIAAHSMGGLTAPGVATRLGYPRVRELVLIAAYVAPPGSSILDTLTGPLGWIARVAVSIGKSFPIPASAARIAFWNGMSRDQCRYAASRLYLESRRVLTEQVDHGALPADLIRTWVMTLRDRALTVRLQRQCISAIGGVDYVVEIDTCHDVIFSEPRRLAEILVERCNAVSAD